MAFVIELIRRKGLAVVVGFALGFLANEVLSRGGRGATAPDPFAKYEQVAPPEKAECFREATRRPTDRGVDLAWVLCIQRFRRESLVDLNQRGAGAPEDPFTKYEVYESVRLAKAECFRVAANNPTEKGVDLATALCMQKFGPLNRP